MLVYYILFLCGNFVIKYFFMYIYCLCGNIVDVVFYLFVFIFGFGKFK